MAEYRPYVTDVGKQKLAAALEGERINLTHIAVGDGGGVTPEPTADISALFNEVWRGEIDAVSADPDEPHLRVVSAYIPAEVGGFFIREIGVFDADGDLIGYTPAPESYNAPSGGAVSTDFYLELGFLFSDAEKVETSLRPGAVASKEEVQRVRAELAEHNEDEEAHAELLAAHNEDATAHPNLRALIEEGQGVGEAIDAHNANDTAHLDLRTVAAGLDARLQRLELMIANDITSNPFAYAFDTLDGLEVEGVWNKAEQRLEF